MDIEIKEAGLEDYWGIVNFTKRIGDERGGFAGYMTLSDYDIIKRCCESTDRIFLIAKDENNVVGLCTLLFGNTLENQDHIGEIGIAIDEKYRGKGISSLLAKEMINISRNSNIRILKAIIIEDNIRAINFFKKMGFKKRGYLYKESLDGQGLFKDNHIYYYELQ